MKRPVRAVLALATVLVVVTLATSALAQATGWPQFQGGAGHPGTASGPEPGYAVSWTYETEAAGPGDRFGLSAPVIADDLVIAVGPESIVAVGIDDGAEAWTAPKALGPSVPGAVAAVGEDPVFLFTQGWGDGPPEPAGQASPTASPSTSPSPSPSAGAGGGSGAASTLVAIGVDDRERRWTLDLPAVSRSGVTVIGDVAIVGANDGSVTAVDVATGERRWSTDVGGAVDVPVAADGDLVVVSTRTTVDATTALVGVALGDGAERWRFAPDTGSPFAGPPTIVDGSVYAGFTDRTVYAIQAADGTQRWGARLNGSAPISPVVATSNGVYAIDVGTFGSQLYALDPATGERTWDHPLGVPVFRAAPIVVGDAVVTGDVDGVVRAFDPGSGDLTWSGAPGGPVRAFASDGSTLVAVRAKPVALVGYSHDDASPLVAIASPTSSDPVGLFLWWAVGALVVGAAAFGLGWLLTGRTPVPMWFPDDEPDHVDEPADEGSDA